MAGMNGWGLTARLIGKHFSSLGDSISRMIAEFDPETATEADRDRLRALLQQTAQKLGDARASFQKEHDEVVSLQQLIASDGKVAEALMAKLQSGQISEGTVNTFCDELEANKARLPEEMQQEADAKAYMDELQKVVDAFSKQLTDFDAKANKARQMLEKAKADKSLQEIRLQNQEELNGLKSISTQSTALSALTKRAQQISSEAGGMKIVADIQQAPIDQANEVQAIRDMVAKGGNTGEGAKERLARLMSQNSAAA